MAHWNRLLDFDYWEPSLINAVRIVFILLFAYIAHLLVNRLVRDVYRYSMRVMEGSGSHFELEKRAQTIQGVIRKALLFSIWVVAVTMMLKEMNFDIRPLLAGAGVVGLALGFG